MLQMCVYFYMYREKKPRHLPHFLVTVHASDLFFFLINVEKISKSNLTSKPIFSINRTHEVGSDFQWVCVCPILENVSGGFCFSLHASIQY